MTDETVRGNPSFFNSLKSCVTPSLRNGLRTERVKSEQVGDKAKLFQFFSIVLYDSTPRYVSYRVLASEELVRQLGKSHPLPVTRWTRLQV